MFLYCIDYISSPNTIISKYFLWSTKQENIQAISLYFAQYSSIVWFSMSVLLLFILKFYSGVNSVSTYHCLLYYIRRIDTVFSKIIMIAPLLLDIFEFLVFILFLPIPQTLSGLPHPWIQLFHSFLLPISFKKFNQIFGLGFWCYIVFFFVNFSKFFSLTSNKSALFLIVKEIHFPSVWCRNHYIKF